LKPRCARRAGASGIGSTTAACSMAGSNQGALRISVAKVNAQPGWPSNLNRPINVDQGYS